MHQWNALHVADVTTIKCITPVFPPRSHQAGAASAPQLTTLRSLVSSNSRRLQEYGFDLDLTCILSTVYTQPYTHAHIHAQIHAFSLYTCMYTQLYRHFVYMLITHSDIITVACVFILSWLSIFSVHMLIRYLNLW